MVILFVHYMFSQILPENAKTVQQGSLGQLSILQMVDEADLEPLRCFLRGQQNFARQQRSSREQDDLIPLL